MGFGYNPTLSRRFGSGERIDMLDYFDWMRRLDTEWTIWDASCFQIVNKARKKAIRKLGDRPRGEDVIETLLQQLAIPKRFRIRENSGLREQYLQRLNEISGADAMYVSARNVMEDETQEFGEAIDRALEWYWRAERELPELIGRIVPENGGAGSWLYLPLEIAEAIYLSDGGVTGKFGPPTEENFDTCILDVQVKRGVPYTSVICPGPPDSVATPYLSSEGLTVWSSSAQIRRVLSDPGYRAYAERFLSRVREQGEPLEEAVLRVQQELRIDEGYA